MGRPLGGKNRKFTKNDKYKILLEHYKKHLSWKEICRKYDLSTSLIYSWDIKFREKGKKGLESNTGRIGKGKGNCKKNEIEQLKEELLKKEIEIMRLKKGYMVKGVGAKKEYVSISDLNIK